MLSSGMKRYHLELMLSSGTKCYHLGWNFIIWDAMISSGANVIIWDKMQSSGANVIMVSSGANVIIWCYHVMLSSGMITHPFFIFPENFTHSHSREVCKQKSVAQYSVRALDWLSINRSITPNWRNSIGCERNTNGRGGEMGDWLLERRGCQLF